MQEASIATYALGTSYLEVFGLPTSCLVIEYRSTYNVERFVTQQISLQPDSVFVLTCTAGGGTKIEVALNSMPVRLLEEADGAILVIPPTTASSVPVPTYTAIRPERAKTKAEYLFLRSIQDVQGKVASSDSYEILKLSGLLRLLLLDNPSLIEVVNRNWQIKLFFPVPSPLVIEEQEEVLPEPYFSIHLSSSLHTGPTTPLSKENFKKFIVAHLDGQPISVEDMVFVIAHKAGGVHFDPSSPTRPGQVQSQLMDEQMQFFEVDASCSFLKGIANVLLEAVKPLVEAISNQT